MIEYAILRVIWWLLMGLLLMGFAILDGFDLGIAALLPFVAKNDLERRIVINTVAAIWEGNQVWFILGGGVLFATWPYLYAISFSGFYIAMFLVLLTFIIRPVGFKYRSKIENPAWRTMWDTALCLGGIIAAFVFGVAIGNVIQGVPFHFNESLRAFYTGSFFELFNPFALLCGLISLTMMIMQGASYLSIKTETQIHCRSQNIATFSALLLVILFSLAGLWITYGIEGYQVTSLIDPNAPSNPLHKTVMREVGLWTQNFSHHPFWLIAPLLGFMGAICVMIFSRIMPRFTLIVSSISIFGLISTLGLSLFPFILPSSTHPEASLLIWDASGSQLSLQIILIFTIIFLPIILLYTGWVYRTLRGKITEKYMNENKDTY